MIDILSIIEIAEKAGRAVMAVYSQDSFNTTYKSDNSPLTMADTASHHIIMDHLNALTPGIPVLSEESKAIPYDQRRAWLHYWLVDPLDGTKEFIRRNGEFTVNIALIQRDAPVMGVVHAPCLDVTYYASKGNGAFKKEGRKEAAKIHVCTYESSAPFTVVASRSHAGDTLDRFLKKIGHAEYISKGSSLKLCLVAEGAAHLYPRLGPTMEWDTAAGQCVVEEAGGIVADTQGRRLRYNKENLLNDHFFVACEEALLRKALGIS